MAILATPIAVRDGLAHMLAMPPLCHLSDEGRGSAELVLAEVLNNIVEHAYPDTPGPVTISVVRADAGLRCLVVDQGRPMPDGVLPKGTLPASQDVALCDLPEGGFGWHLIRSLTTDLGYASVSGCNHLRFTLM